MIIPMNPENVRITVQLTSADFESGAFTHDIDLQKLYDNRNSCAYEFVIDYNGQQISNEYQMFYNDGTLYTTVFFPTNDGQMLKLTLTAGEGAITVTEPELPAVTSTDNGKVLTVVEGDWAAANASSGLPAVSGSDNGKVLTVSSGAWTAAQPSGGLPDPGSVTEGSIIRTVYDPLLASHLWSPSQTCYTCYITTDNGTKTASMEAVKLYTAVSMGIPLYFVELDENDDNISFVYGLQSISFTNGSLDGCTLKLYNGTSILSFIAATDQDYPTYTP